MSHRYTRELLDKLEKLVGGAEAETSAELVIVLARRSEPYTDVPWKLGGLLALIALVLLVFLPISFREEWLLADTVLAFLVGFALGRSSDTLARLLTSPLRRTHSVRAKAEASFTNRGISLTHERSGVLMFLSWAERRVELLWDIGIERKVPMAAWNLALKEYLATFTFRDLQQDFARALVPLRRVLKEYLPPEPGKPNEIPNRPVVL